MCGWEVLKKEDVAPQSRHTAAGAGCVRQTPVSRLRAELTQAIRGGGKVLGEKHAHAQEAVQVQIGSLAVKPLCFLN